MSRVLVVSDGFPVPGPAQQLVDRFLAGYPRDGAFYASAFRQVALGTPFSWKPEEITAIDRRKADFGSPFFQTFSGGDFRSSALYSSVVVVPAADQTAEKLVHRLLPYLNRDSRVYIVGALSASTKDARLILDAAREKRISIVAAFPTRLTWRLPQVEVDDHSPLSELLVVSRGENPSALWEAADVLVSLASKRRGGESGIRSIEAFEGQSVWTAGQQNLWSWSRLASAISRSNSIQGDSLVDSRTQDVVGLGLVPKLATSPRAYVIHHNDGLSSSLLMLTGVLNDINVAYRYADGSEGSTQIYQPPLPWDHQYSAAAAHIEDFLRKDPVSSNEGELALMARLLETFATPR